jgi:hypothetical protein
MAETAKESALPLFHKGLVGWFQVRGCHTSLELSIHQYLLFGWAWPLLVWKYDGKGRRSSP